MLTAFLKLFLTCQNWNSWKGFIRMLQIKEQALPTDKVNSCLEQVSPEGWTVMASLFWKGSLAATVALEGKVGMQLGKLATYSKWRKHLVSQSQIAPEGVATPSPKGKVFLNHFPNQLQLLSKVMALKKEHTNQNTILAEIAMKPEFSSSGQIRKSPSRSVCVLRKRKIPSNSLKAE